MAPPGTKGPFVPVGTTNRDKRVTLLSELVLPTGIKGLDLFVPGGATNRDKKGTFCPGWYLQSGQKAPVSTLARLAFGPGTNATYCPGPKGNRDKWSGTKTYSWTNVANVECYGWKANCVYIARLTAYLE